MKISLVTSNSVNLNPWIPEFKKQGIEVLVNSIDSECDFIVCATNSQLSRLKHFHKHYPNIKIICYAWDLYEWIWTHPRGYDWKGFGDFLKKSVEIWVPSEEVALRAEEYFGVGDKCQTIHTFARFFEYQGEIKDKRYVYQAMRNYEADRNYGWLRKACSELSIPLYESHHKLSERQFQKTIAECSFLVTEYHEASTGGLTLLEAYRLGKPVLISDSKYMGARDYFGDKAFYFEDGNYENFKSKLKDLWDNTPSLDIEKCREYTDTFSIEAMVSKMIERLRKNNE